MNSNIKGKEHYQTTLKRIQTLMQSNPAENSEKYKEMDMLVSLVERYEEIYIPMIASDPIEYLRYKMHHVGDILNLKKLTFD